MYDNTNKGPAKPHFDKLYWQFGTIHETKNQYGFDKHCDIPTNVVRSKHSFIIN